MSNAGDDAALDMAQVKAMADVVIMNDGSLEELKQNLIKKLGLPPSGL
jgi:hypothetical protein